MSRHEYETSKLLGVVDPPFYGMVMALMRQADSSNLDRLQAVFPEVWDELEQRYNAPGGALPDDPPYDGPTAADMLERLGL